LQRDSSSSKFLCAKATADSRILDKDCASDFRRSPIASPCRVSIIGRPSPAVFWRVRNLTFAVETHDNFSVNGHSATFNGPFLNVSSPGPTLPFIQCISSRTRSCEGARITTEQARSILRPLVRRFGWSLVGNTLSLEIGA
jgi:hypothetical protein